MDLLAAETAKYEILKKKVADEHVKRTQLLLEKNEREASMTLDEEQQVFLEQKAEEKRIEKVADIKSKRLLSAIQSNTGNQIDKLVPLLTNFQGNGFSFF